MSNTQCGFIFAFTTLLGCSSADPIPRSQFSVEGIVTDIAATDEGLIAITVRRGQRGLFDSNAYTLNVAKSEVTPLDIDALSVEVATNRVVVANQRTTKQFTSLSALFKGNEVSQVSTFVDGNESADSLGVLRAFGDNGWLLPRWSNLQFGEHTFVSPLVSLRSNSTTANLLNLGLAQIGDVNCYSIDLVESKIPRVAVAHDANGTRSVTVFVGTVQDKFSFPVSGKNVLVRFVDDGKLLAYLTSDQFCILDIATRNPVFFREFERPSLTSRRPSLSFQQLLDVAEGPNLVVAGIDDRVLAVNAGNGAIIWSVSGVPTAVAISPDGKTIHVGFFSRQIHTYKLN